MVRQNVGEYNVQEFKINSPKSVAHVINTVFDTLERDTQENFGILLLDNKHKIIGAELITRGTSTNTLVSPLDIFQRALLIGANALVVFHNHPSGDTTPSSEDLGLTDRIKKGCELLGLRLLDHVIIGDGEYTSFMDKGYMTN